jgi:hypothetical protein
MAENIQIDNFWLGHNKQDAIEFATKTWAPKQKAEKRALEMAAPPPKPKEESHFPDYQKLRRPLQGPQTWHTKLRAYAYGWLTWVADVFQAHPVISVILGLLFAVLSLFIRGLPKEDCLPPRRFPSEFVKLASTDETKPQLPVGIDTLRHRTPTTQEA